MTEWIKGPGFHLIQPTPGPIDYEKVERDSARLKVILEEARIRLSMEEVKAI